MFWSKTHLRRCRCVFRINHRWRTQGLFANLTVICCWWGYKIQHITSITVPTQHRNRSLYGLQTFMTHKTLITEESTAVSFNPHLSYTSVIDQQLIRWVLYEINGVRRQEKHKTCRESSGLTENHCWCILTIWIQGKF